MIDPNLALFVIDAGVALGRKIHESLVDQTVKRPLLLPLGDLFGRVTEAEAMRFFAVEQPELIRPGGPCYAMREDKPKLIQFYSAMRGVETRVVAASGDLAAQRREIVLRLSALDQFDETFPDRHPTRQILSTVVEIGVDYFNSHPEARARDSGARKIVQAFVAGVQDADLAESPDARILGGLLGSALRGLRDDAPLIDDEPSLTVVLGAVSGAVAEDLQQAVREGEEVARQQLFRRAGSSLLRGALGAFSGAGALSPVEGGITVRRLVQGALVQVLRGLQGHEDLFTHEALERIVQSALRAAAENPERFVQRPGLETLVGRTTDVLAGRPWDSLFSAANAGPVLCDALQIARENRQTAAGPDGVEEPRLAQALEAMVGGLSGRLAGGGNIERLLSRQQVVTWARWGMHQAAQNPERLLGEGAGDSSQTVLAQVIASVAKALGNEPARLTNGEGFLQLTAVALQVTLRNTAPLIDTDRRSPRSNRLYQILQQVVGALGQEKEPGRLVTRQVFLEIAVVVLPLASGNLAGLRQKPKLVSRAVVSALRLAQGPLEGRINGANVATLIEGLLTLALWNELDLEDEAETKRAALECLRAA